MSGVGIVFDPYAPKDAGSDLDLPRASASEISVGCLESTHTAPTFQISAYYIRSKMRRTP